MAAAALIGLLASAAPAAADGDPASDVLASQRLFVPADGGYPATQAARLTALLAEAERRGIPIRVAMIASPADLGSVTELWRRPQSYAQFLGEELSQVYRGMVLVAMPNGFGTYATPGSGVPGSLASLGAPGPLLPATIGAVEFLTRTAGHPLSAPAAIAGPASSGSALGSVDPGSWIALAVGAILIAAAWAASLRAGRPSRQRDAA